MTRKGTVSGGGSRPGRLAAIAATLIAPGLLYLVMRTAAGALAPAAAAALPPPHLGPLLRQVVRSSADYRAPMPEQAKALGQMGALTSPLAFEPFFIESKVVGRQEGVRAALPLMKEALRRRPSSLIVRLHLMAYYAELRSYDDMLAQMDYILKDSPRAQERILPELVKLVRDPQGRSALADLLAKRPPWREDFFKAAKEQSVSPGDASQLMQLIKSRGGSGDLGLENDFYIHTLAQSGQVARARSLWLERFPPGERQRHAFLFDGQFKGPKAQPPFGWDLHDRDVGRAELSSADGVPHLNLSYFGGQDAVVAEQLLALRPGSYRLTFKAKSDTQLTSGRVFWAVSCSPSDSKIGAVEVQGPKQSYTEYSGSLRVPAGNCGGQVLRLLVEAGDISNTFNVQFADLRIIPQ